MSSSNRIERDRGIKESHRQLAVLRDKWPLACPLNVQDVRPLAIGSTRDIASAMSWPLPYTLGVLSTWKMAPVYCEAVLRHDQRIDLDGALAEPVEAQAKELATKRLAQLAERKAAKSRKGRGAHRGSAEASPYSASRDTRDAGAIAQPGACVASTPQRIATFAPRAGAIAVIRVSPASS
jgi:sRNA-binding protein